MGEGCRLRQWLRGLAGALILACIAALAAPAAAQAAAPAPAAGPDGARYPIIFIPGLSGSEMWNGKELVWLNLWKAAQSQVPVLNWLVYDWLLPLELKPDGRTPARPEYRIRVGEVLRKGLAGAYASILSRLEAAGYREGADLFLLPYDWRRPVPELAGDLSALVALAIERNPEAGQVVLIGHSMGGLVAREYIQRTSGRHVRALVAIGTPWLGTAVTYKALARGWDMGFDIPGTLWKMRAPATLHRLVQNWPSVYELLPGSHYARLYGGFIRRDGEFLPHDRVVTEIIPAHNPGLAALAGRGDALLDGQSYGVRQFLVAGYSRPTLLAVEEGNWYGFPTWKEETGEGDGTVSLASADLGANFDPGRLARFIGPVEGVAYVNVIHSLMTNSPLLQDQVLRWLADLSGPAPKRQAPPGGVWLREPDHVLRQIEGRPR